MKLSIKEIKPLYYVECGVRILKRKEILREIKEEDYKGFFGFFIEELELILKKYSNKYTEINIESKTVNIECFYSGLVYDLEINIKNEDSEKDLIINAEGFDVYNQKCSVVLIREIEKNIKEK